VEEEQETESKQQKADAEVTSIPESDITSTSDDISVPNDDVLEICTKSDFESDGTTLSDAASNNNENENDFSQWTDSMDELVALFDLGPEKPTITTVTTGLGVGRSSDGATSMISDSVVGTPQQTTAGTSAATITSGLDVDESHNETASILDSPARWSGVGILAGNTTTSPSGAKRHLASTTFDRLNEPPISRQRQVVAEARVDDQTEMSPLRKTLASTLSLRTS